MLSALTAQGYEPITQSAADHDYKYRKRGTPRPKVRMGRPPIAEIKDWAGRWGAELRRNRDGSYDALLQIDSLDAWKAWQRAASQVPGQALVAARYTMTFPEEALSASLPGSAITGEEYRGQIRVIGTPYAYAENHDVAMNEVFSPSDGVLDETKAGLVVLWGAKVYGD